jgi:hypothetical protein
MSRRPVRSLAIVLLLAAGAAQAANKTVDAGKVFPLLADYLKLPAGERSHFAPVYYLHQGQAPAVVPVWLIDNGQRTPIPVRADGRIELLPSLAALAHDKVEFGVDGATKLGVSLSVEPIVAPAADLDARELAAAVAQAAVGVRKAAGIKALAMPKIQSVTFVGAGSGEVEFADGRRAPLPLAHGAPSYNPATQPNARRIRLAKVPLKLDLD